MYIVLCFKHVPVCDIFCCMSLKNSAMQSLQVLRYYTCKVQCLGEPGQLNQYSD